MSNSIQVLTFDAMKGCQTMSLQALKELLVLQLRQEIWMRFPLELQLELKPQLPKFSQDQIQFYEYLRSIQLSPSLLMWQNTNYFSILALTKLSLQIYRTYMIAVCCIAMPALQAFLYTNCNTATDAFISSSFL